MMTLPHFSKKLTITALVVAIVLAAGVPSYYFYSKYRDAQLRLQNPTAAAEADAKQLVAKIGALIQLPADEVPTIATVSDREKLKEQAFFANAQNGDKVVIYTKAKKAILYREAINKIIEVGPISFGQTSATPSATAQTQLKFALLNGTTIVGLTKRYETELKGKITNAAVVDHDNAKRQDYAKTLLVDVTGTMSTEAAQVAQVLGISVANLPAGEATPAADFLIIVGEDKK